MESNTVILFQEMPVTYRAPFHHFTPTQAVHEIHVGSQVALYGHIRKYIDGEVITEYLHLRGGAYRLEAPIQFVTFHGSIL